MSASLSPRFLADLSQVYETLRPQALSAAFLSDLAQVHATLLRAADENLPFLAKRFDEWRRATQDFVRSRLKELPYDDPLKCPISLFRTMDYGRLETAHTRTLAWLLDPNGEHGFEETLLEALLRRLPGGDYPGTLRVDWVKSEFLVDGSGATGRLDVLAEGAWENGKRSGWVLVIEAKVDAGEGEDQLQKYETWLKSNARGRKTFRVFLTPDGRPPETGDEKWESINFLELVQTFRAVYGELRHAPGFHFLRFYLAGVLQDICHLPRNVEEDAPDPYAVASYLKTVRDFPPEAQAMTQLGKPLVFYLKYLAEMNRLNGDPEEGEEPDLGLGDAEHVREMARTVGAAAYGQVGDFLELCGKGIEDHFSGLKIAMLGKKSKRASIIHNWYWGMHVHVPSVPDGWFSCCVMVKTPQETRIKLEKDVRGVVVPYIWAKGGPKAGDAVLKILGSLGLSRGDKELNEASGLVALAYIPIKAQPSESFDVDRDPLIAKVAKTVARIGAKETMAIASFVAGLKGADES